MKNNQNTPFIKWLGGKKQILDKLKKYMPQSYNRYYEPFIGGGALFFELQPNNAVINDINGQLVNAYRQLKINPEAIIARLKVLDSVECDNTRYRKIRGDYNKKVLTRTFDEESAALLIWVNKHCFNGLYRVNSKGLFNAAFNYKPNCVSMDETNLRNIGTF